MAKRTLKPLTSPDAFGLFVNLLARYARDASNKTEIEKKFENVMGDDPFRRAVAGRLFRNFKLIPIEQRVKELKDLAEPNVNSFPEARFESAINTMPIASNSVIMLADDVSLTPLPPLDPLELININFSGIFCSQETGDQINLVGASDEIYVVTNTIVVRDNGENLIRSEKHPLSQDSYKDVDTAEFRVGPLAACYHGRYTEVSLVCTVMEHDQGDPDAFKDEITLVVSSAATLVGFLVPGSRPILPAAGKLLIEALNWLMDTDDDIVETVFRVFEVDELRRIALAPPKLFVGKHKKLVSTFPPPAKFETVSKTTDILHHFATSHSGGGGKYNVCFRLKRSGQGVVIGGSGGGGVVIP